MQLSVSPLLYRESFCFRREGLGVACYFPLLPVAVKIVNPAASLAFFFKKKKKTFISTAQIMATVLFFNNLMQKYCTKLGLTTHWGAGWG